MKIGHHNYALPPFPPSSYLEPFRLHILSFHLRVLLQAVRDFHVHTFLRYKAERDLCETSHGSLYPAAVGKAKF